MLPSLDNEHELLYPMVMEILETDKAMTAAWIEGEGCITITSQQRKKGCNRSYSMHIIVTNNDRRVCEWLKAHWGGSIQSRDLPSQTQYVCYRWQLGASAAATLLKAIYPYMLIKRDQAALAIAFQEHMQLQPYGVHRGDCFTERQQMQDKLKALKTAHHTSWI